MTFSDLCIYLLLLHDDASSPCRLLNEAYNDRCGRDMSMGLCSLLTQFTRENEEWAELRDVLQPTIINTNAPHHTPYHHHNTLVGGVG